MKKRLEKRITFAGAGIALLGLAFNPYVIGRLFSNDGVSDKFVLFLLYAFSSSFILAGGYLFVKPKEYANIILAFVVCSVLWFPIDFTASAVTRMKAGDAAAGYWNLAHPMYDHAFIPNGEGTHTTSEFSILYKINSLGLRSPEPDANKTRFRILALGDSMTQGHGVNETDSWPRKLEEELGGDYEVVNAGVASYSPTLEYLYLANDGIKLQPDLIILAFDNNDIVGDADIYRRNAVYGPDGEIVAVPGTSAVPLRERFKYTTILLHVVFKEKKDPSHPYWEFDPTLTSCDQFVNDWNYSLHMLNKTKTYLDDQGIPFIVVIYPYGHQVGTDQWTQGRLEKGFRSDITYPLLTEDCFTRYSYGINLTVFNVLEDFRNAGKYKKIYYEKDVHMNAAGYTVMAEAIAKRLKESHYVKE